MKNFKGYFITVIAALCWGFSGTMGEYLLHEKHLDPNWVTAVRMLGAGVILMMYILLKNGITDTQKELLRDRSSIIQLVLYGVLGLAANQLTYLQAIQYSNSGTATVLQYSGTVLLVIVVCAMAPRLPFKTEVIAVALALLGTFLLATHGNINQLVLTQEALIWGMLSAVATVTNTLLPIPLVKKYGSSLTIVYGLLVGGLFLSLIFSIWNIPVQLDFETILALFGMIVVGTIFAYNMFLIGVNIIGSIKASLIACLEPVAAIVFSMLFLGTSFVAMDFIGSATIVSAAAIVSIVDLILEKKKDNEELSARV
ncbi:MULTISPECIES: DMT family transporter [unclassified Granulicatella]|uniref:DMT family transporter n=1 Tax=unclassified Granulicatella TaxID=2630493 RepID=UPI001073488A|nr:MULTISPECIES: DMT family transporter [unclassified Granulicatella]MBF0780651.1 EamA family transporter [Granulicatella sp. 19428wC4_WM01]TFU94552.1 EamA family transporter [Granulicatella sp. WM01]